MIREHFDSDILPARWKQLAIGQGWVNVNAGQLACSVPAHDDKRYHNAQIDDYQDLKRAAFPWRPPLEMTVQAWTSHPAHELRGTAGFGFWNHPFMPGGGLPRLPKAIWFFFASPPSNMALAMDVPGHGWKAATFDAQTWLFGGLLPFTPLGLLLMRIPALYRRLWPLGQKALTVSERKLDVTMNEPHVYRLQWRHDGADFWVDESLVHSAPYAPKGPLGFVTWLDNQYAIVTPQGRFGFGFVDRPTDQSLFIDSIEIKPLAT